MRIPRAAARRAHSFAGSYPAGNLYPGAYRDADRSSTGKATGAADLVARLLQPRFWK